jgi:hypothetical protein
VNPGEQFDAMVDAHMKKVADENKDVVIVDGRPHLKVERDDEGAAYCFFDHRFWYFDNPDKRYFDKRSEDPTKKPFTYTRNMVCPASEDYSE